MEKGYFQTSPEIEFTTIEGIALPNQLPPGLDFTTHPNEASRSSTVETLIGQNEDLMARLSISLRRTNDLEERNEALLSESQNFRTRFETLREQYLILQEKDRATSDRSRKLTEFASQSEKTIQKLERRYADVYSEANAFNLRLTQLERYRARVRKVRHNIKTRLQHLAHVEAVNQSLQSRLQNTNQSYEAKLNEARIELEKTQQKAIERDFLFEENIRLQNQLLLEQRQTNRLQAELQSQNDNLTNRNHHLGVELKETILQLEHTRQTHSELEERYHDTDQEVSALREQVESLQALWSQKHKELEKTEEKNYSLQKLNQSLSETINSQRRDLLSRKTEIEQLTFNFEERIRQLTKEIQMLRIESTEKTDQ